MSASSSSKPPVITPHDDLPPGLGADGSWTFDAALDSVDIRATDTAAQEPARHPHLFSPMAMLHGLEAEGPPAENPEPVEDADAAREQVCRHVLPLPVHVVFDAHQRHAKDRTTWTLVLIQTASGRIKSILAAGAWMGSDLAFRVGARRYAAVSSLSRDPGWMYQTVITVASSNRLYDAMTTPSIRERLPFRAFLAESVRDQLSTPVHGRADHAALIRDRNTGASINRWHYIAHAEFFRVLQRLAKRARQDAAGLRRPAADAALQRKPVTGEEFPLMLEVVAQFKFSDEISKRGGRRMDNVPLLERLSEGLYLPLVQVPEPGVVVHLYAEFPNFREAIDIVADALALCARAPDPSVLPLRLSPILLVGPPGVGKSSYCVALAAALGYSKKPLEIDFAVTTAPWVLSGLAPSWEGSRHGLILETLLGSAGSQGYGNALIVGNEVDKADGLKQNVLAPLLSLLEPTSACRFVDEFAAPAIIDASRLIWILTANDAENLPEPLLSRLEVVQVPAPTAPEMRCIAERMYAAAKAANAWGGSFPEQLSGAVLDRLACSTNPREMKRALGKALGTAARANASCVQLAHLTMVSAPTRAMGF